MRLLFKLLPCVILAYALAAYMAIPANPEIKFWQEVNQRRDEDIAATRSQNSGKPIIFFAGGSSCAFSIDPKIVEETCGIPAYNLGLPISAGAKYLLHQALEKTRKGDILVVALEPDALTYPSDFPATTFTFGMATLANDPSATLGGSSFGGKLTLQDYLNYPRPGPGYVATWLGKFFTGRGYRYTDQDIRYHGRIETQVKDPALPFGGPKTVTSICPSGRELLETFQKASSAKQVSLFYSMPWFLTSPDAAENNRAANLKILNSINPIIPTIDDGHQGVATDPDNFADSGLHLTAKGSQIRSQSLAKALHSRLIPIANP